MVHIAVLDSGCRKNVPGIKETTAVFSCHIGSKSTQKNRFGPSQLECVEDYEGQDPFGHGTGVHLCITQIAPWATIDHYTVLNEKGVGNPELLCNVLDYVIGLKKHQIINLSLGLQDPAWVVPMVKSMKKAYENNIAIVAAANNLGALPYPAQFTYPLCCKAVYLEELDKVLWYPNSVVEFGARGVHIPLTFTPPEICWVSGSSFAAAHLTGICAQVLKRKGPLTPLQLKSEIIEIAVKS